MAVDRVLVDSELAHCLHSGFLQPGPVGTPEPGNVDEGIAVPPFLRAGLVELAEVTVGAGFGGGLEVSRVLIQQGGQLPAKPAPIGLELLGQQRLGLSRAEPQVDALRWPAGQGFEGLGVEAELEHVARLGLRAGQLGVNRLPDAGTRVGMVNPYEEVGDPPDPLMDKRHLVDHVVPRVEGVADPVHPVGERFPAVPAGNLEDVESPAAIGGQAVPFVLVALLHQKVRQRAESRRIDGERAGIDLVLQVQEVGAVQPCRDLRRGEQAIGHRFTCRPIVCPLDGPQNARKRSLRLRSTGRPPEARPSRH